MTDTETGPGFYLVIGGQVIAYAPEAVDGPGFTLHADHPEDRASTGINGWKWYESRPTPE